ncbi:hypothetical protein M2152_002359 [Microbacteriaceae bacterium SG_E_30_P1]|uniref:Uncharacterized protein n=1 Tax=Antiquaquibacter oligotrophicus TaxID=2880260 RepID=A0ABT6KSK8_9MICO|nr:hypothetical protein [Antiquaquibacter oligotrophicus]MDH6182177.1 hypothetical protein [Antiquaquibacter oligotrophicus]UDF12161.1 hypothetical protein LH407_08275 [Antiquaquibacter oligotrophicus]
MGNNGTWWRRFTWPSVVFVVASATLVGLSIYRLTDPPEGPVTTVLVWAQLILQAVVLVGLFVWLLKPVLFWRSGTIGENPPKAGE